MRQCPESYGKCSTARGAWYTIRKLLVREKGFYRWRRKLATTIRKDITTDLVSPPRPHRSMTRPETFRDEIFITSSQTLNFGRSTTQDYSSWARKWRRSTIATKSSLTHDKTGNRYEVSVSDYQRLMHDNLTRDYKLDNENKLTKIDSDTKKHARSLEISDRMECHQPVQRLLDYLKDHKEDFPNAIKCRVINPACNNLGKVSKRVLDKINSTCREAAGVNQWKSTQVRSKLVSPTYTQTTQPRRKVDSYNLTYANSTRRYRKNSYAALSSMRKRTFSIDEEEMDLVMASRRSVLFSNGKTWTKKGKDFDVTMGAQVRSGDCWTHWHLSSQAGRGLPRFSWWKSPHWPIPRRRPHIYRGCQWTL